MAVDEPFDAVGVDPVGVLTTAGEAPAPLDAVAVATGVMEPAGLKAPATMRSGPVAKTASKVARGNVTRSTQAPPPIMTIHATDASADARSS